MAVNTNKIGYSIADVCQILHCSNATLYRLINEKEIECLITDPKTPGGRRQFRFLKEHIQHYLLKHFEKFEDVTLRSWGVITTPKKIVQNACTPRVPIDAFSKPIAESIDRNMAPTTAREWASPPTKAVPTNPTYSEEKLAKKPYIRTPEIKEAEKAEKTRTQGTVDNGNAIGRDPKMLRENQKFQKTFPKFKIEVDTCTNGMVVPNDIVIPGIESFTAGEIAKALLTDRNFKAQEIRITFDGMSSKD